MPVSFAEKKDQTVTHAKDDPFDLLKGKRFLSEGLTQQIIVGFVGYNDLLVVLAKEV